MSYTYLLNLYRVLESRIAEIEADLATHPSADAVHHRLAGRRDCLKTVHAFLLENYDRKLPRRLQQMPRHQLRD